MQTKSIKLPGPDHPIAIKPNPARVTWSVAGRIIADTREALTLREASYPAVQYIPRKDVDMSLLQRTDHATYCPYKGDCACSIIRKEEEVRGLIDGLDSHHEFAVGLTRFHYPVGFADLVKLEHARRLRSIHP